VSQFAAASKIGGLEKRLQSFQPQMKNIAGFKSMYEAASRDEKAVQELAKGSVEWSRRLNRLSNDLPAGIWISDLNASKRQLVIKCSVVSLDTDPMELINSFLSALKDDPDFFTDFSSFDLGTVQKRMVGTYEVADFTVTMEVKPR
jgi:Tfp pilus assembly protein PilN